MLEITKSAATVPPVRKRLSLFIIVGLSYSDPKITGTSPTAV